VPLTEQDPMTGVVVLNRMRRLPASAAAERIGMVTGASMARLAEAMRGVGAAAAPQGETVQVDGVNLTVAETGAEDRTEIGRISDSFREGKRNAILVLFSTAGRGAIHVTLTDDLVSAGRKAGDLVNRIAALSGGRGGGRPHFASAGAGDPARLPEVQAATPAVVSAWLGNRAGAEGPRTAGEVTGSTRQVAEGNGA
jgi:alanyl-tRNA synthetase